MSSRPEIDELISGYLDGILAESERLQVERLLNESEEAKAHLRHLRLNRNALAELRSVKGKPKLGRDFAQRVIAEAQRQAIANQLPIEHHVRRSVSVARPQFAWPWQAVTALASIAALILVGYVVYRGSNPTGAGSKPSPTELVDNTPVESKPEAELADNVASSPFPQRTTEQATSNGAEESLPKSLEFVSNDRSRRQTVHLSDFLMLITLDVFPSLDAWQTHKIDQVLKDNKIASSSPIVSTGIHEALNNTRAFKSQAAERGEAFLIFVVASNRELSNLIQTIENRRGDFPRTELNVAADRPSEGLLGKLLKAVSTDAPIVVPFSAAVSASNAPDNNNQAESNQIARPLLNPEAAALQSLSQGLLASSASELEEGIGFILLVIHAPK